MFNIFCILLLVLLAVILTLTARQPDQFRVARRITIHAPAQRIFPYLNDLHQFQVWSPFEQLDPAMQRDYNDIAYGVGACYQWQGSGKAGHGSMQIIDETVPSRVLIRLVFTKPFKASNEVEFLLHSNGDDTDVSWAMTGTTPFIGKIMHVLFNMDRMVGRDFEAGLQQLRQLVEQPAAGTA